MIELRLTKGEARVLRDYMGNLGFAGVSGSVLIMLQIETRLKELLIADETKKKAESVDGSKKG